VKRRSFLGAAAAGATSLAGCSALRRFRNLPTTGAYPQRFYDAANTNHVPASAPSEKPTVYWTADVLGSTAPTVRQGRVYAGTRVLNQASGEVSHELDTKRGLGRGPVAGENYLFAVTTFGVAPRTLLQAFAPNDGTVRWETGSEIPFRRGQLALAGGRLFTPVRGPSPEANRIAAFDTEAGDVLWTGPAGADEVAVRDGTAFVVGSDRREVRALDASDGTVQWRADGAAFFGRPVVSDGRIFVRTVDGGVHALDTEGGRSLWTHPQNVENFSVADETAYVALEGEDGFRLRALDTATGEPQWTRRVPSAESAPTVTDDAVLVGIRTGFDTAGVVAYDRSSGEERWRFVRDRGQPETDSISSVRVSTPVAVERGLFVSIGGTLYGLA